MSNRRSFIITLLCCVAGCAQPKLTLEDLKKMPKPERPKELAMLEPMVGSWTGTGEMIIPGLDQKLAGTGANTVAWDCDGRVLIEHFDWQMPDLGANGSMKGIVMYTFDPREKEFHMHMASSMGDMSRAEMTYDEKTKTWNIEEKGRDPMTGQPTKSRGTMKMPDNNTLEWQMTQYDAMGMTKKMEMKGTSKRK